MLTSCFKGEGRLVSMLLQFINQEDGVINANDPGGSITLDPRTRRPNDQSRFNQSIWGRFVNIE